MLTIDRQALLNSVASAGRFVAPDSTAFIGGNGDGELTLRVGTDECGAECILVGVHTKLDWLAVSLVALRQVLRFCEGPTVELSKKGEALVFRSGRAEHTLALRDDEPPEVPDPSGVTLSFGPAALSTCYARTWCAKGSRDGGISSPWAVAAVQLSARPNELVVATTDAISLAVSRTPVICSDSASALLPVSTFARWATGTYPFDMTTLRIGSGWVVVGCNGATAWVRSVSGRFPAIDADHFGGRTHELPFPLGLRGALNSVRIDEPQVKLTVGATYMELVGREVRSRVPISKHKKPLLDALALDGVRLAKAMTAFAATGQPVLLRYADANRAIGLACGSNLYLLAPHLLRDSANQLHPAA